MSMVVYALEASETTSIRERWERQTTIVSAWLPRYCTATDAVIFRVAVFVESSGLIDVMSSEATSGMDVDGGAGRDGLTTTERTSIATVVNAVVVRCQMASNDANFKAAVRARRKLLALPMTGQCLDVAAISDAELEVCYAMGAGGFHGRLNGVVPYGGLAQHPTEARFDNKQKTARGALERAFGRLKGMWRLFLRTHKCNMDSLPQQFVAVCILHNILIDAGVPFDDNLLWEVGPDGVRRPVDLGMHQPLRPVCMESLTGDALILRDALALAEWMIAQ
ncbi:hypothetical protein CBR_g26234 [Chara braunii]|uniref:DDE Tnp4 domain-containing protein n=1 Tax=Chara braunii TaxID=69332 RepID=A0A388L7A2_CHABU|nr:hypothetical protein CBR_g26234 [Chara braunii]|eukprot:GBG78201.1 hypothetical protein CBR_g26234 [Chara braunii]